MAVDRSSVAGRMFVEILPDVSRFTENLRREMSRQGRESGRRFSEGFNEGTNRQFNQFFQQFHNSANRQGYESGRQFSRGMGRGMTEGGRGSAPWAIRTLTAALVGLGPAAIPAFAAVGGAALSAGAAIASAGAALGVFGLAAKAQITPVVEAYKEFAQAQEAYRKATTQAAKDTALQRQKIALQELSPIQIRAVREIQALKQSWESFGQAANRPILDSFILGMQGLRTALKNLQPAVLPIALYVRGLAGDFANAVNSQGFKNFANWIANTGPMAVQAFVNSLKNFGSGLLALGGHVNDATNRGQGFLTWLVNVSERFERWANGPANGQIRSFMAAARQSLPVVAEAMAAVARAISAIIVAAGPLGGVVLKTITVLANAVADMAEKFPWLIQGLWAAAIATKAWSLAMGIAGAVGSVMGRSIAGQTIGMRLLNLVTRVATITMRGFAIAMALATSPIGLIVIGITALVAAVVFAYKKFPAFRAVVDTVIRAVVTAFQWLWGVVKNVVSWIGTTAVSLWQKYIGPAFRGIASVVTTVLGPVIKWLGFTFKVYLFLIRTYVAVAVAVIKFWFNAAVASAKWLGSAMAWLYNKVIKPIWSAISAVIGFYVRVYTAAIKAGWAVAQGIFKAIQWTLKNVVAPAFSWLYSKIIKPVMTAIGKTIGTVWNSAIRPVFNLLMHVVRNQIPSAFDAAKKAIEKIWNTIRSIAAAPIKFFLVTVWNGGLGGLWDKAKKIVPGLPDFPRAQVSGFARGGVLPGRSQWHHGDDQLVPMRRGEGVYVSEAMKDPYERARLHAVNRAAMHGQSLAQFREGSGFAKGGILDKIRNVVTKPMDLGFAGISALKNKGVEVMAKAASHLVSRIGGSGGFPDLARGVAKSLIDRIASFLSDKLPSMGVGQARDVVETAIKHLKMGADGDQNNRYQRAFGMPGQPWCAMFISEVFKAAGAGGSIPRSAAVSSFAGLPARKGAPQPGDLGLYGNPSQGGAGSHINLYIGNNETIGGNEGNAIRRTKGRIGSATKVVVPKYAATSGIDGVVPPGARSGLISQAMRAAGVPPPGTAGAWMSGMKTLVERESGWRVASQNNWDINAKNGNASRGLAQTIPSTFKAFHAPGTSWNIFDPIANLAAAMRYIKSRYGSITNVQQANPNASPRGYALGGMVEIANQDIGWSKPTAIQEGWRAIDGHKAKLRAYANGGHPGSGQLALVGEEGPELVRFKGAAQVYPHAKSMAMMAQMAGIPGYAKGGKVKKKPTKKPKGAFSDSVFQTLAYQLSGTASQIALAGNKLIAAIRDKFSGKKESSLVGLVTHGVKKLNALASQMATAKTTLTNATRFQQKTVENIKGMFSPEQLVGMPPSDMIAYLKEQAADAAGMSKNIAALKNKGYSASILATMLEMDDPRDVADFARDLSSATASQVKQINSLVAQGTNIANSIGNQAFLAYTGGKTAAQLTKMSKGGKPQKVMNNMAHDLAVKLGKQLGVKKPPKKKTFDNGGYLEDVAFNRSGKPEPVFSAGQWSRIDRLVKYVDHAEKNGTGGDVVNVYTNFTDADDVARAVESRKRRARVTNTLPPVAPSKRRG